VYPNIGRQFFMIFHFQGKFLYRTCLTLRSVLSEVRIFQAMYLEKKFFILHLGNYCNGDFDIHRAVHHNIIPIVKPTRCTSVSNLFNFEWHSTWFGWSFRPSSGVQDCTYACCCMYSHELLMLDGKISETCRVSFWNKYADASSRFGMTLYMFWTF